MRKLTHGEFLAMRRFDALDGLRAFAAVIVIFFHFGGRKVEFLSGWIGVHAFFIISGFLITTLMLRERDRTGRVSLRNFYIRRIFRIMPLYYVVLAVVVVGAYKTGRSWTLLKEHLPNYLGFMNEYHLPAGDVPYLYSWTIGIEQKFYLVWPLALILVSFVSSRLRIPLTIIAIALVLVPYTDTWRGMGIHYAVLLTGALLAIILHQPRGFALFSPLTHPVVGAIVGAGFVTLHLNLKNLVEYFDDERPVVFLYGVAVALFLPTLLAPGIGKWTLSLRPLVFVGERSYGLYLIQGPAEVAVVAMAPHLRPGTVLFAIAVTVIALFAADALHHRLEKPMVEVGRRLIKTLDARKPTPTDQPPNIPHPAPQKPEPQIPAHQPG
ncbi:acyltransferase family protein [Embleya scabrispora]|uniref:acyltransferase family protein n=1 Tax=Embleya scabrispora TaxID=159449 RepID=UPI001374E5CC|nr:acyltransferase [Embleya scabrispora]